MRIIHGFGIANFRSFGDDLQFFGPLKKVNLVIGQNNSGKSNAVMFVHRFFSALLSQAPIPTEPEDNPQGATGELRFALAIDANIQFLMEAFDGKNLRTNDRERTELFLRAIVESPHAIQNFDQIRFEYLQGDIGPPSLTSGFFEEAERNFGLDHSEWQNFWHSLTGQGGGSINAWINESLDKIEPRQMLSGSSNLIPAIRKLGDDGDVHNDHSGVGLIDWPPLSGPP